MRSRTRIEKIGFLKGLVSGKRSLLELQEGYNTLKTVLGVEPDITKFFKGATEITMEEFARLLKLCPDPCEFKVSFMTDEEYERYFPPTPEQVKV